MSIFVEIAMLVLFVILCIDHYGLQHQVTDLLLFIIEINVVFVINSFVRCCYMFLFFRISQSLKKLHVVEIERWSKTSDCSTLANGFD